VIFISISGVRSNLFVPITLSTSLIHIFASLMYTSFNMAITWSFLFTSKKTMYFKASIKSFTKYLLNYIKNFESFLVDFFNNRFFQQFPCLRCRTNVYLLKCGLHKELPYLRSRVQSAFSFAKFEHCLYKVALEKHTLQWVITSTKIYQLRLLIIRPIVWHRAVPSLPHT